MAKTNDKSSSNAGENPPKNLQKVLKAKNREVSSRMIIEALNRMDENLKNGESGHSLAKIRNYIKKMYGLEMPKHRQDMIKGIIGAEYANGRIEMVNGHGVLNFTKRFQATIGNDDIENETLSLAGPDEE